MTTVVVEVMISFIFRAPFIEHFAILMGKSTLSSVLEFGFGLTQNIPSRTLRIIT